MVKFFTSSLTCCPAGRGGWDDGSSAVPVGASHSSLAPGRLLAESSGSHQPPACLQPGSGSGPGPEGGGVTGDAARTPEPPPRPAIWPGPPRRFGLRASPWARRSTTAAAQAEGCRAPSSADLHPRTHIPSAAGSDESVGSGDHRIQPGHQGGGGWDPAPRRPLPPSRPARRTCLPGTTEVPASPPPLPAGQQVNKEVENLTTQLQLMTRERDELRNRLASVTDGGALDSRPYHRLNTDLERMKMERIQVLSDLQKMKIERTKASEMCKEQAKETGFFRNFHSRLLSEQTHLKGSVDRLAEKNRKLLEEQNRLQRCLEDMKVCSEEDQETDDLCFQQLQEGDRREADVQHLLKKKEQRTQQRILVARLQRHYAMSEKRFEKLKQELDQARAQNKTLLLEMERLKLGH